MQNALNSMLPQSEHPFMHGLADDLGSASLGLDEALDLV